MAVRQQSDGTWRYVFDGPLKPNGGRNQVFRRGFKTKKAAETAEREHKNELDAGFSIEAGSLTVETYLRDRFLKYYAPGRLKPSTVAGYEQMIRIHVVPQIGKLTFRQLRPLHLEALYRAVVANGRSLRTARLVHAMLHVAFAQAVRWQIIGRNPADAVEPPRPPKARTRTPTVAEQNKLFAAGDATSLGLIYRFLANSGMRRGEALALHWDDVDFDASTVRIRGSVRRQGKSGIVYATPKTEQSTRTIKIPATALTILRVHRTKQIEEKLGEGPAYKDNGVVFANALGGYRDPDHVTRSWATLAEELELPDIRLHDLRHSYATRMLEAGVPARIVQELLGHSQVGTTLNLYTHVSKDLQADAVERLDAMMNTPPATKQGEGT